MNAKEKYRSKLRDAPRILHPVPFNADGSITRAKPMHPSQGRLGFRKMDPTFSEIFKRSRAKNTDLISKRFQSDNILIKQLIDNIYEYAAHYFYLFRSPIGARINNVNDVLYPCFYKSLISIYTAFDLNSSGLYGPARPHVRHAFESMMIAKYCSVHNDTDVFDKWVDGLDIYFSNQVIKKIVKPDTEEIKIFWKMMCEYSHATAYAVQPNFDITERWEDIGANFVFIQILLAFSFHLLNSHIITKSMRYYESTYSDNPMSAELLREEIKALLSKSRRVMTRESLRLIKDYRSKWIVKR